MAREVVTRGRKFLIERDPAWAPGRHVATFSISDLHYRDDADQWQPIDLALADDTTDGFAKSCDKARHRLRVGAGGTRRWYPRREVTTEYVTITALQYWRTQGGGSWRDLNLPTPVWRSEGADWDLTNLSASLTHTWRGIKTEFVLKNSSAYTRLRFAITLTGLTLGADWALRNSADEVVGWINAPSAEDATEAAVPVTATYAGGYIEWSVDTTGATFPVTVDPTFTDGYGGDADTAKDDSVNSVAAENNYGIVVYFLRGATFKGLAQYDLSSIPASAVCNSASWHGTYYSNPGAGTITIYSIASGNAGWVEGTKNGTTAGAGEPCWEAKAADGSGGVTTAWAGSDGLATSGTDYEASALGSFTTGSGDAAGTTYEAALTSSRIEGWFGSPNTNYGLLFVCTSGSASRVASSNADTASLRPYLTVDYTEVSAHPAAFFGRRPAWATHLRM